MDVPKYTEIDGKSHLIVEGERTECGLVIPFGNGYTTDPEGKVHCGKDADTEGQPLDLREPEEAPTPFASDSDNAAPVVTKATKAK